MLSMLVIFGSYAMLINVDGKVIIAYSSVSHITMCIIVGIFVGIYIGYIHIVISPLMFLVVYLGYQLSGSRYYKSIGVLVFVLMVVNVRFPYMGAFSAELYLLSYSRVVQLLIIVMYMLMGYVLICLVNFNDTSLFYIPLLTLYLILL